MPLEHPRSMKKVKLIVLLKWGLVESRKGEQGLGSFRVTIGDTG